MTVVEARAVGGQLGHETPEDPEVLLELPHGVVPLDDLEHGDLRFGGEVERLAAHAERLAHLVARGARVIDHRELTPSALDVVGPTDVGWYRWRTSPRCERILVAGVALASLDDDDTLRGVVNASSGGSWIFADRIPRALQNDLSPRAAVKLLAEQQRTNHEQDPQCATDDGDDTEDTGQTHHQVSSTRPLILERRAREGHVPVTAGNAQRTGTHHDQAGDDTQRNPVLRRQDFGDFYKVG